MELTETVVEIGVSRFILLHARHRQVSSQGRRGRRGHMVVNGGFGRTSRGRGLRGLDGKGLGGQVGGFAGLGRQWRS